MLGNGDVIGHVLYRNDAARAAKNMQRAAREREQTKNRIFRKMTGLSLLALNIVIVV
jgi:hypothetical protein